LEGAPARAGPLLPASRQRAAQAGPAEVSSIEELTAALNRRRAPWLEAVAIRGDRVLETLGAVLEHTMQHLTGKYRSLALEPGVTGGAWTWGAIQQVFGRTTLARTPARPGEDGESDRRRVQVAVARLPRGASEVAADKGLIDSYVHASMELSQALDRMREERDEALRRVETDSTLRAIEALGEGEPPEETLQATLTRLAEGASCGRSSLIAPGADRHLHVVASVGMARDPFLASPAAFRIAKQRFVPLKNPLLLTLAQSPDIAALLAPLDPPVKALAVAPIRSAFGLHGLAMLYFAARHPLPSATALTHIGLMARALAAWFPVRRGRSLEGSAVAARRALPEIERVAKLASDLVRAAARQPEMAKAHLERAARTLDGVATLAGGLQVPADPPRKKG
jgi:hypothetical protein